MGDSEHKMAAERTVHVEHPPSPSAKECVTTSLPNQLAMKMDGARGSGPYLAIAGTKGRKG